MFNFYRKLSLVVSLLLFISVFSSPVAFASNNDIQNHWAAEDINKMIEKGYLTGYPDGSFNPDQEMTRAQFVKVINKVFGFSEEEDIPFSDLESSDWYYRDIRIAYKAGYIKGISLDEFGPNEVIKRQDVAVILARVLGLEEDASYCDNFSDNSQISDYAKGAVGAIAKSGIMIGYNDKSFNPNRNITRAEVIVAERASNYAKEHSIEIPETPVTPEPTKQADSTGKKSNESSNHNDRNPKQDVVLSEAEFNGLTRITVKTNRLLEGVKAEDVVITKKGGAVVSSDKITKIQSDAEKLTIDINTDVFTTESIKGTTIGTKGFDLYNASNTVSVGIKEEPLPKKDVILSEAEFNGLTRITVKTNILLEGIKADDIVITKKGGAVVSSDKITKIQSDANKLTIDLSTDVFTTESIKGTTIGTKGFDLYNASNTVSVGIKEEPLPKKDVILSEAEFNGLTRITVKTNILLEGVKADDIVITKKGGAVVSSDKITKIQSDANKLTIDLSMDVFATELSEGTTIGTKDFGLYNASNTVSVGIKEEPLPKKDVILSEAEFNGLTRITVKTNILLEGVKADDIVITKKGGAVVSSDKITKIQSDANKLTIDLSMDVFATESSEGTTIGTKDFGLYNASNTVSVGINGDTLEQVLDRITTW